VEDLRVGGIVLLKWILNRTEGLRLDTVIYSRAVGGFCLKTITNIQFA
jgi:hypothetical protein